MHYNSDEAFLNHVFGPRAELHSDCWFCGGRECFGEPRSLPDGSHVHYCQVNNIAATRVAGACQPDPHLNAKGQVCPVECGCADENDPSTWGECSHDNNDLCEGCAREFERQMWEDRYRDDRREFEYEVAAAASWIGY